MNLLAEAVGATSLSAATDKLTPPLAHLGVAAEAHLEAGLQLAGAGSLSVGLCAERLKKNNKRGEGGGR